MSGKLQHLRSPMVQPMVYRNAKGEKEGITYVNVPLCNIVFCGHVDAGKSTTTGQLLVASDLVSEHTIKQLYREANAIGKGSFALAWITDTHLAERTSGTTRDICHVELFTGSKYYTIIDAPGHTAYIKNMITGSTQADVMGLIIDAEALYARIQEWKAGYQSELKDPLKDWSTRQHAVLCRGLGVAQGIIVLNKMDMFPESQRPAVYNVLVEYLSHQMKKCGFPLEPSSFVPISARQGLGINKPFPGLEALQPLGLIQVMDAVPLLQQTQELPLRMHVEGLYKDIAGTNAVATGKVQSGSVAVGQTVMLTPSKTKAVVRSIEMHRRPLTSPAVKGCNIGIDLKGLPGKLTELKAMIGRNAIISHEGDAPQVGRKFSAKVVIINLPSELGLVVDRTKIIVHMASGVTVPCTVRGVREVLDLTTKTLVAQGKALDAVGPQTRCILTLEADIDIPLQTKATHPRNSCMVMRQGRITIGWGVITDIQS